MICHFASCTSLPVTLLASGIFALNAGRRYKGGALLIAAVEFILGVKFHLYRLIFLHEVRFKQVGNGIDVYTLLAAHDGHFGH